MAAEITEQETEQETAVSKSGGSLKGNLIICCFMGIVVIVECVLAFLFIPSADEVAALAEEKMTKKLPAQMGKDELVVQGEQATTAVEVELGDFSITVSQANSNLSLRVDFQLFGTVIDKDKGQLEAAMKRNKHRFRDQIIVEIRNSDSEDLNDSALGLIKRRILEKSNTLLGKPLLRSVVFSQFSYIEQ
ncbi:MAG: hypothetical protein QGG71_09790 [Pirellulaceae bacterium]|jgi:flagellar FliL protein|nr:hypothetical protein [Pirellulaceae bacterium]